jgi:hypothetical protein
VTDTRLLESMAGLKDALALEVERFDREVRWNAAPKPRAHLNRQRASFRPQKRAAVTRGVRPG